MTAIAWDKIGDRRFYTGIDHGVFYPKSGPGVAWNGLSSVTPKAASGSTTEVFYFGQKLYDTPAVSTFAATIEAYSSPEEADIYLGMSEDSVGFVYDNQAPRYFDMSYRTIVGNDTLGDKYGYQIHMLYDLMAVPTPMSYNTINDSPEAELLSWSATSRMSNFDGPADQIGTFTMEQTGHVIFDSRKLEPEIMQAIENVLYGDCFGDARMISLMELRQNFGAGVNRKGEILG